MGLVQNINGTSTAIAGESRGANIFYISCSSLSDIFCDQGMLSSSNLMKENVAFGFSLLYRNLYFCRLGAWSLSISYFANGKL